MALPGYMTMLRLSSAQRTLLVEKLPHLANLFAGGFVVGQSLGSAPFSGWLFAIGFMMWLALMGVALVIAEGGS